MNFLEKLNELKEDWNDKKDIDNLISHNIIQNLPSIKNQFDKNYEVENFINDIKINSNVTLKENKNILEISRKLKDVLFSLSTCNIELINVIKSEKLYETRSDLQIFLIFIFEIAKNLENLIEIEINLTSFSFVLIDKNLKNCTYSMSLSYELIKKVS